MKTLNVSTEGKQGFQDITDRVERAVSDLGVKEGACLIFCPHTTAGLTLNENWDASVQHDMGVGLSEISPPRSAYRHSEGNSPAHLKSTLVGASHAVPIHEGKLVLGRWQGVFLCEFDGPRTRHVHIQVLSC